MNLKVIWLEFSIVISYVFEFFDLPDKLPFEFKRIREITNLTDMHKEIEIIPKEVEFQKKLVEYWEGWWNQ